MVSACAGSPPPGAEPTEVAAMAAGAPLDKLILVDCLLPGQVRRLGSRFTYLSPRRPIKTTASDCEIRGGEYVAFDRADYATALKTLLPKAQAGDPIAQNYVGEIYEKGLGLPQPDYTQAAQWYRKAAEQGHATAQTNLGFLYERGLGVSKDSVTALNWYRKASGLDQDQLTFESSLEAERQAFREEIQARDKIAAALRGRLQQTQQQLAARNQRLQAIQQDIAETQRKLQQARRPSRPAPAGRPAAVAPAGQQEPALQSRLQELKAKQNQDDTEKAALQRQAEQERARLQALQKDAESRAESLSRALEATQQQLAQAQGDAAKAANLRKLQASRKEQYDQIKQQVAMAKAD